MRTERGQLVLLAAVLLALALVPVVFAYLQLGYHDDIGTNSPGTAMGETERAVERGVHESAVAVREAFAWDRREAAVAAFRDELASTRRAVSGAELDNGRAVRVEYNQTRAALAADRHCPDGAARQFGECDAIDGVVVQERAGTTHVLSVAIDLQLTGPRQERTVITVLRPTGR
ncbi:MAG: hypothetical protein V5A55_02440 [Halovenus sp.]